MIKAIALASAFVAGMTTASFAETPEQRQACTDDAFKFCEQAVPDQDRVFRCLVQNHKIISRLCQTALAPYVPAEPQRAPVQTRKRQSTTSKAATTGSKASRKGPLNLSPDAR